MRCFVHTVQKWIESSAYDHHFHNINTERGQENGFFVVVVFFFSGGELHTKFEPLFFSFIRSGFFPFHSFCAAIRSRIHVETITFYRRSKLTHITKITIEQMITKILRYWATKEQIITDTWCNRCSRFYFCSSSKHTETFLLNFKFINFVNSTQKKINVETS